MRSNTWLPLFLVALSATAAMSAPASIATESTQTVGLVGISIPLGGDAQPRFAFGLRQATVGSDGSLDGGEVRVTLNPANLRDVQVRAMLLRGTADHSGALGAGWDFGTAQPFASGGVVLPHVSAFADIGLTGLQPRVSVGLDSAGAFDVPDRIVFDPCPTRAGRGVISLAC